MKKNSSGMDKVLNFLQKDKSLTKEQTKVYYRPDKKKSIIGFICSVIFFLIAFAFCIINFSFGWILLLGVAIGLMIFYGANVFTKDGLFIQKYVDKRIVDEYEEELEEEESERKEQD